jgi:signal transduction histidine kinase
VEILALYTSPDALGTALAAGARHLAATVEGFALVYQLGNPAREPEGWAGFTCAKDAETASEQLAAFRKQVEVSDRPLRSEAPETPPRIWGRAAGGVYGFPLRQTTAVRGVAIVGCPGAWPKLRNTETESILKQIALVLDHHAVSEGRGNDPDPSDELLLLSEQLLAQDVERIKQDEHMEQVQRLQGELVEKMTHELQTPLNTIIERVIGILAGEHENLSEAGRDSLRTALDGGNKLLRLLQNISDLWRVKQNRMRVEVQDVNIAEVVDEAIFNVRDTLKPEIVLEKHLSSPLPKIRTDLAKLNQILFHLLDNAAKFTDQGRIELGVSVEQGQLQCSVSDTGIGISTDDRPYVFDELTRALVEQLGGSLMFTSEIGQGSCFSISLPVTVL